MPLVLIALATPAHAYEWDFNYFGDYTTSLVGYDWNNDFRGRCVAPAARCHFDVVATDAEGEERWSSGTFGLRVELDVQARRATWTGRGPLPAGAEAQGFLLALVALTDRLAHGGQPTGEPLSYALGGFDKQSGIWTVTVSE